MFARAAVAMTNPYLGSFLKKRLESEEIFVDEAATGDELLSMIGAGKCGIVFVQADIPGKNGFEVCCELKSDCQGESLPVVIMSGDAGDEKLAADARADVFLRIPFDESELMAAVSKLLKCRKTILLVDDSKLIHNRTGKFLREQGFNLLEAYNGVEGLEIAVAEKPDLIISDIEMPEMNGFEMCAEIKDRSETALTPVVMVSSLDKGIDIESGFEAGANDYLVKPVVHAELLSCINSLLRTMEYRRRETIMVVGTSPKIENMLKFGMMRQGFTVTTCSDSEDAFEKATEIIPDVIIADMDMPSLEGGQFVKYLKEQKTTRDIPIVIMASRESRGEVARGLRIGAAAFLSKPFTMDKVLMIVERITAERRLMREREAMKMYLSEAAIESLEDVAMQKDGVADFRAAEKYLTIFFSDIVGFTSLCERLAPKEVVAILNNYMDVMTIALKNNGAIIDKFIGDAILAVFGPDSSGEEPQFRAAKAALEMFDRQIELNSNSALKLETRIGINSGRVIFGDIGSKFYRRDFTVIGDPVNIAQRLQVMAEPDTVLISESVYVSIKHRVEVQSTGSLKLKGKEEKIETYRVNNII